MKGDLNIYSIAQSTQKLPLLLPLSSPKYKQNIHLTSSSLAVCTGLFVGSPCVLLTANCLCWCT